MDFGFPREEGSKADIRRRLRTSHSSAEYSLVVLLDALRAQKKAIRGSSILLVGFPRGSGEESRNARVIRETLAKQGARLKYFVPREHADVTVRSLDDALHGIDAAIIATDARAFRLISRKDFRSRGIAIAIPTELGE